MAFVERFEGLSDNDFSVYRPEAWASNLYNLERMRTRSRLVQLVERAAAQLDRAQLELGHSAETPSIWNQRQVREQWAFLWRDRAQRQHLVPLFARGQSLDTQLHSAAEHTRHALLCARIDHEGLEVGLSLDRLARVDLDNLLARIQNSAAELDALLSALPEGIQLAGQAPTAALMRDAALATQRAQQPRLSLGLHLTPDAAIERGEALGDEVARIFNALAPIWQWFAWRPDNDLISAEDHMEAFSHQVEAAAQAEAARVQALAHARAQSEEAARERTASRLAADEAWRRLQRAQAALNAQKARESAPAQPPAAAAQSPAAEADGAPAEAAPAATSEAPEAAPQTPRAPREGQRAPREDRRAPREGQRAPREGQRAPRDTQRAPRDTQRAPREGQRAPREGQRAPRDTQRAPREGQRAPRDTQRAPTPAAAGAERPRASAAPERPAAPAAFAIGDRVRLSRGLLAGRVGTVAAFGTKGYLSVQVGSLVVPVAAHELELAGGPA